MKRRAPLKGDLPGQFQIDWNGAADSGPPATASPLPASRHPELVQPLRWDFKTSFPEPTQEAIDAGIISDEDCTPEQIKAIHEQHAGELLAALRDYDSVLAARRRGVDPVSGRKPMNSAGELRLRQLLSKEPARLERWWQTLIDTYESAFGSDAADAFGKAVRAWHAGIDVTDKRRKATAIAKPEVAEKPLEPAPVRIARPRHRHAVLPVPRPLPSAVAAVSFGTEENGESVCPGPREVREITQQHAEKLIALLDSLASAASADRPQLLESFQAGIKAYEGDFGRAPAEQLEAYVKRQAGMDSGSRRGR